MSTFSDRVRLQVADGVAELRLVRPQAGNAIDPEMVAGLAAAVEECLRDEGVRAILLAADGKAFTLGGDLGHFGNHLDDLGEELARMIGPYHQTLARLYHDPRPIVCALSGPAAGGGLGLVWCADVVLASSKAVFTCSFSRLGLSGDGGSSWFLPRLVGSRRAAELIVGGRVLGAQEALEWGLVSSVVEADELDERARSVAAELAAGPPVAFRRMRELLRDSPGNSLEDQLACEVEAMRACSATNDASEGIRAFAERRQPRFDGN